jgi:Na+/H+ antiporter NhaD/arsenite permease-like protein
VLPFFGLLIAIAVLPLAAKAFWHRHRNRAFVAALFAVPMALYLIALQVFTGQPGVPALQEALAEYVAFICLLGSLYTVAGGVVIHLHVRPGPLTNSAVLAAGAVLANLVGTTGASMLLVRPFLRLNRHRQHARHLPVFFIFLVSNLGGLLTPLGDPPLFLGFLHGIDFFWTLGLWPQWALANGLVLAAFLAWEALAWRREPPATELPAREPLRVHVRGAVNFLLLAGILATVLFQSEQVAGPKLRLSPLAGATVMAVLGLLSLALTPRNLRDINAFSWAALIEVAVLFAGIFVTMVPALELLREHGDELGLEEPWQFFWLTGGLSMVLDNAPTYLTFATLAAQGGSVGDLPATQPLLLAAVSCGAVFLGAMTYIGNGPNFMVRALADEAGYRTPSFLSYLGYAVVVLVPVFVLVTLLFFPP